MGAKDPIDDIPHERKEPRPDFSKPIPRKPLPKELQNILNDEEKLWEVMSKESQHADTTDSTVRYAAYAARFRTILSSAHRYVAYTSDVGESFRPVAHPWLIRGAYGISWLYIGGDVAYEGYKNYQKNLLVRDPQAAIAKLEEKDKAAADALKGENLQPGKVAPIDDYRTVMAQRLAFQSIASMGLPAFTIHSVVRYSGRALKNAANTTLRTYGPIGLGLAVVPALPYLFDKPVEHAVEWTFHKGFELIGGPQAVEGRKPSTEAGLSDMIHKAKSKVKDKVKEL